MEEERIAQFNEGNACAFTFLYRKFQPRIFFFVQKFISNSAAAEDITAEVFIKLWNGRGRFTGEKSVASFLYVAARNASIDWLRRAKRENAGLQEFLLVCRKEAPAFCNILPGSVPGSFLENTS